MIYDKSEFLWSQKYRPQTVKDCILPENAKKYFLNLIEGGELNNLLLSGSPGTGKSTVAKALCNDLSLDVLFINASDENGIDVLRSKIKQFASTVSFNSEGNHKVVILDEADALTNNAQSAFRGLLEEYSKNCRFILTCNYKNRIIEPLRNSRFTTVDFVAADFLTPKLMKQMLTRLCQMLDNEKVEYDKAVVAELLKKNAPDFRRTIQELQRYAIQSTKIDSGILGSAKTGLDLDIKNLLIGVRDKNFKDVRKWVTDHSDVDPNDIFRRLYETAVSSSGNGGVIKSHSVPQLVLILADYQHRSSFVVDQEINTMAALVECMAKLEFSS